MCGELTSLNKNVKREVNPLPRASDMLTKLSEGILFPSWAQIHDFGRSKRTQNAKC